MSAPTDIPMPDGFELRRRRSDREDDGKLWTPADALYDVHRRWTDSEKSDKVEQMVVYWVVETPEGKRKLRFSSSTQSYAEHVMLLSTALHRKLSNA